MNLKQTLIVAMAPAAALANILQLQSQLPACSLQCLSEGADMFGCTVTDLTCMCSKVQDMTAEVAPCMVNVGDCELEEILQTTELVGQMCTEHYAQNNITLSDADADPSRETDEDDEAASSVITASIRLALTAVVVATIALS
jgi:hypothetical protein